MKFDIISNILAVLIFLGYLYFGYFTNILRENGKNSPYSFKKFQLWLWTMVITPLYVIHWGNFTNDIPYINNTGLILLGIATGTFATAQLIANTKLDNNPVSTTIKEMTWDNKSIVNQVSNPTAPTYSFYSLIKDGDGDGNLSLGRLQCLVFNIVFAIIYICYFFDNHKFPDFSSQVFTLLGISSSGYLTGKSLDK